LGSVDSAGSKLVLPTDSAGLYSSGYLLFHQQSSLLAQKFDPARGTLSGDPVTVATDVENDNGTFHTVFSVSNEGTLLYQPGASALQNIDLLWMDREGKVLGHAADSDAYKGGRLSPDGRRLAVSAGERASPIWILDLLRGTRSRITFDDLPHRNPSWSADGERVAYNSLQGATIVTGASLHAKPANGSGGDELLLEIKEADGTPDTLSLPQWSSDGRYLVYLRQSGPTGGGIWAMPTSGGGKPFLVAKPESPIGRVVYLRLSPDSHWLAYSAIEGSREEVYVTSFPEGVGRWQISREGGTFPVWRGDEKEIYYYGLDATLDVVQVNAHGNQFEVGTMQNLFPMRNVLPTGEPFDVTPDGKRFLVFQEPEGSASPMTLVLNWNADLK